MRAIRHICLASLTLALLTLFAAPGRAATIDTSAGPITITKMIGGLDKPWGVDFLPGGGVLVTQKPGELLHFDAQGTRTLVSGVPDVVDQGQGGLLDVMIPRDFAVSREVFLTFAKRQPGGAGTALGVGQLSEAGDALTGFRVIFEMSEGGATTRHYGSRITEATDGSLFVTIGDRGVDDAAQTLDRHNGKVVRVNRDGSVPADNPFVSTDGARPEIWSLGHRNPQGAALDASGQLWVVEHGARGGDEVNRVTGGANYGWPVIAYGTHYSGAKIGLGTEAPGLEQPVTFWDPSMAPSGMAFHSGAIPAWDGHAFIGSLKFDYISVLDPSDWSEEQIRTRETRRVRDVAQAPDGMIWFLSEDRGALYRIAPAN